MAETKLTKEEKLRAEQEKAGWFTSEWGEWRAPVTEVTNEVKDPYLKKAPAKKAPAKGKK